MCLLFNIREMLLFNIINEELLFGALRFQHSFFTFFFFLSTTSRVFTLSLWILHWNLFLVGWCPLHCFPSCPSLSSLSQPHLGWADQSQIQRHTLSKQFVCGNAGCPGNLHQEQSGRSPETTFGWLEKTHLTSGLFRLLTLTHSSPSCSLAVPAHLDKVSSRLPRQVSLQYF